jgi:uncharacterized protein (TIGR03067 family)
MMTVAQPDGIPETAKAEIKKLQGTWTIELQDVNGKELREADLKGRTISFGLNAFLVRHKGAMEQIGKITKIDPAKKIFNAAIDKDMVLNNFPTSHVSGIAR